MVEEKVEGGEGGGGGTNLQVHAAALSVHGCGVLVARGGRHLVVHACHIPTRQGGESQTAGGLQNHLGQWTAVALQRSLGDRFEEEYEVYGLCPWEKRLQSRHCVGSSIIS